MNEPPRPRARRTIWTGLGLVALLLMVLAGYYFVHKPISPMQAASLASALADAGVAALLACLAGGVGRRLFRPWVGLGLGEQVVLQAALGWGLIGLGMLGLGLAGLYLTAVAWLLAVFSLVFLWRDVLRWVIDVLLVLRGMQFSSRLAPFAALFVVTSLSLGLLRALAPPLMWDALVYHLTLPKLYVERQALQPEAGIVFAGMPQLAEMLYGAAFLLRGGPAAGARAAQALGWLFSALLVVGLAAHAWVVAGRRYSVVAPAILLSALSIALSLSWGYADGLLMLYALATMIALRQWRLTQERRWFWLAGVLAGLAVSCKYTGALVPLAGAAVIVFEEKRAGHPLTRSFRHLVGPFFLTPAAFLLIALLVFSPWLVKNWLFTGNPFYPLLFGGVSMDGLRQWFYSRPDLAEQNPLWALLIYFRAVFLGVQGGNEYDATLGPLWVFLPLALGLAWRRLDSRVRGELAPLVVFVVAGYLGWVLALFASALALQARLFLGIFPALALLAAAGVAAILAHDSPGLRVSVIASAGLTMVFGLSLFENAAAFVRHNPLPYLFGEQSAAEYRAANLGWYAVAIERVNGLPDGARVVFLWEARSLECAGPERCLPDVVIDRWWHLRRTVGPAGAILEHWKAEGATHVLVYEAGLDFIRADPQSGFEELDWTELDVLRGEMTLLEELDGVYYLYALP